jgi:hypothetical protein
MKRFTFIPIPTPDGRHLVLQAVPLTRRQRLRRLLLRFGL